MSFRQPSVTISKLIQRIIDGRDIRASVEPLRKNPRQAIALLLPLLDGRKEVRPAEGVDVRDADDNIMQALSILARENVEHVVALLHAELQHDRMQPAFSLAWTLAHLDDRAALGVLVTAVRHRDAYVRWAACTGLRRLQAAETRDILNRAASDRSSMVRLEAVEALEHVGDESSLPALTKRLRDRYPGIQSAAQQAIKAIEQRSA